MSLIPIADRIVVPCSRHSVVSKNEIIILYHWISHTLSTSYLWKSQESPFQHEMRNCDVKKKAYQIQSQELSVRFQFCQKEK